MMFLFVKGSHLSITPSLLAACFLLGCASTQRVNQFATFAEAGQAYTEAMVVLTDEAGRAAIDSDSQVLVGGRSDWDRAERVRRIRDQTAQLDTLLAVLGDLRQHSRLLGRYFAALSRLAEDDAPSAISKSAANLVAKLGNISPRLEGARIGEASIGQVAVHSVSLVVGSFKASALEAELKRSAAAVDRELGLQEVTVAALAEQMKSDLKLILNSRSMQEVVIPYIDDRKLPSSWDKERREILTAYVTMSSAENAKLAASELRKAFAALVENRFGAADLDGLFEDIHAMIDLIELVKGAE